MRVKARLFGDLKKFSSTGEETVEADIPDGSSVSNLVNALEVDRGELWRASVDKKLVELDYILKDGDEVFFFPPIGGGSE